MRTLLALSAFAAVSTVVRSGVAAPEPSASWTVEVTPEAGEAGCDRQRLAREVQLACDALGGRCSVTEEGGARHARLVCEGSWTLEARGADGALLWTVPLSGESDRVRQAALWIARAGDGAPPGAVEAHAPETATVAVTPPPVAADPPAGLALAADGSSPERPSPTPLPSTRDRAAGLLAGARGSFVGGGFGPLLGARVAGAVALPVRELAAFVDVAGGRTTDGPAGFGLSSGRAGVGLAWGAPWGKAPLGVALEGGAAIGDVTAPSGIAPSSQTFVRAYGEASVAAQWNGARTIRPFAAISACVESGPVGVDEQGFSEASIPWISASLDVGVAWRSW